MVVEWIPYNQFGDIEEILGRGGFATVYSAIWKDGQLYYGKDTEEYVKSSPNEKVALKFLHNSQILPMGFKWGMKYINLNLIFKLNFNITIKKFF